MSFKRPLTDEAMLEVSGVGSRNCDCMEMPLWRKSVNLSWSNRRKEIRLKEVHTIAKLDDVQKRKICGGDCC
ncbi:MAG: hypothetical protein R2778_10710 [Saprospiraceae bacterium]